MRVQQPTERIKPGSGGERGRQEVIRSSGHGFNIIYLDRKLETLVAFFKNQDVIKHLSIYNRYVCFNAISKYLHNVHNIYIKQLRRRGYESSPFCKFCLQIPETIEQLLLNCMINHLVRHYLNKNLLMSVCVSVCSIWTPKPFGQSSPNLAWA